MAYYVCKITFYIVVLLLKLWPITCTCKFTKVYLVVILLSSTLGVLQFEHCCWSWGPVFAFCLFLGFDFQRAQSFMSSDTSSFFFNFQNQVRTGQNVALSISVTVSMQPVCMCVFTFAQLFSHEINMLHVLWVAISGIADMRYVHTYIVFFIV